MAKRDYYEVLGVLKSADENQIKRAYRKLAKEYHPDTNQGNQYAEQKFKEVTEAYEVLSDPEKKKLYDKYGFAAFDGSMGAGGFDEQNGGQYREYHFEGDDIFGDIFDDLFGGGFAQGYGKTGRTKQRKGHDVQSEITISFEEAALGCKKKISFQGEQRTSLEVQIPAGIDEGQSVRLKGKGYGGDLYLKIHIAEKPGYERKGMDVYTTENIPYTTAVLGGTAVFHTLYGNVKCQIPPGTQSGSKIRLRQKGIVSMKNPSVYGDAYVTVQIAVPKNVTPQERKVLQELENIRYKNVG